MQDCGSHDRNIYVINIKNNSIDEILQWEILCWRTNLIACSFFFSDAPTARVSPEAGFRNRDINPIWHGGGGMMPLPKNVLEHCAQTLDRKKLKHVDF